MTQWTEALWGRDTAAGYEALQKLLAASQASGKVYPYMGQFLEKLGSGNSFFRTRALALLFANAKWDTQNQIEAHIDQILLHITDQKPVTARCCIQGLPALGRAKPGLRPAILAALRNADTSLYPPSMRPLVDRDIQKALQELDSGGAAENPA